MVYTNQYPTLYLAAVGFKMPMTGSEFLGMSHFRTNPYIRFTFAICVMVKSWIFSWLRGQQGGPCKFFNACEMTTAHFCSWSWGSNIMSQPDLDDWLKWQIVFRWFSTTNLQIQIIFPLKPPIYSCVFLIKIATFDTEAIHSQTPNRPCRDAGLQGPGECHAALPRGAEAARWAAAAGATAGIRQRVLF